MASAERARQNVAAHDEGQSFALLNLSANGIHGVALYASDTTRTNLAIHPGSRHLYTSLVIGYTPGSDFGGARP